MTTFTFNLSTFELGRGPRARMCLCFNEALLSALRSAANNFYRLAVQMDVASN